MRDNGYALVMDHAVRHVALALDKAAPAALSVSELARGYDHPVPSDLSRVKRHEQAEDDKAAILFIIRKAAREIAGVEMVDDLVTLHNGTSFDTLRWKGKKIERPGPDIHEKLHDPFNPMSGVFSNNIREELTDGKRDTAFDELRESLKTFGWVPEFPALVDEHGVVLVGNRRMALAKELGIEPVKQTIVIGKGDAADARRLKIAIVSNIGSKKLSPNDRKRIARHLFSEHEWTMERIGEALNVTAMTISNDLRGFKPTLKPDRPKGGRPRKHNPKEIDITLKPLFDSGLPRSKVAEQTGLPERTVREARERYNVRQEMQALPATSEAEAGAHFCTCKDCGNKHLRGAGY